MTYLEKHKNNHSRNLIVITSCVVVTFIVIQVFSPRILSSLFTSIALPFWRTEFSIESGSLSSQESLLRENEDLKQQLITNSLKNDTVGYVNFENSEIRSLMGKASSTPYILSAVLERPPVSSYDELVIDAGSDQNLSTTSTIYIQGNIPIGRVVEVLKQTSKVVLFSSPGQKQEVLIGPSHIPATTIGRGGGQYEAQLPRGLNVKEGDYVIASDSDSRPIGRVVSINTDSALSFQKVLISLSINIYQLRWVLVNNKNRI